MVIILSWIQTLHQTPGRFTQQSQPVPPTPQELYRSLELSAGTDPTNRAYRWSKTGTDITSLFLGAYGGIKTITRASTLGTTPINSGGKVLWTSWRNYPKVSHGGREYAQVGDRLYARHAVDRMQPSGLGTPAGAHGPGRSISPNYIEDILTNSKGVPVHGPNGAPRLSFTSGTVQVITENNIVVTVITP